MFSLYVFGNCVIIISLLLLCVLGRHIIFPQNSLTHRKKGLNIHPNCRLYLLHTHSHAHVDPYTLFNIVVNDSPLYKIELLLWILKFHVHYLIDLLNFT